MSEHNTPKTIWAATTYVGPRDMRGEWATDPAKVVGGIKEYTLSDLMPRWRPIAELPQEWVHRPNTFGNRIIVRNRRKAVFFWGEHPSANREVKEFLDFGGKSMPD